MKMKFIKSTLQYDWLANQNINRHLLSVGLSDDKVTPVYVNVGGLDRGIPKGGAIWSFNSNVSVVNAWSTSDRPTFRPSSPAEPSFLPPTEENIPIQIPQRLVARDITGYYRKLGKKIAPDISYDMTKRGLSFFALSAGFGIMPPPDKKVDWVRLKVQLVPPERDQEFLRIYDIAPPTTFQETSSLTAETNITAEGKLAVPKLVPSVGGSVSAMGKVVYKTMVKFARSVITASTNQNDVMSWEFKWSKTTGEDPRGDFRTTALIGIPMTYGKRSAELSKNTSTSFTVKASIGGWIFRNNPFSKSKNQPITKEVGIDFETV